MRFEDKYTITDGEVFNTKDKDDKDIQVPKLLISNDTFALGEVLEKIANRMDK